jgi:hypothetical protein
MLESVQGMDDPVWPPDWWPVGAKVVQLKDGLKRPATSHGKDSGVRAQDFVPLGKNLGIVLDNLLLVLDTDRPNDPAVLELVSSLPPTWTQKTPRGRHYVFKMPLGVRAQNTKIYSRTEKDEKGNPRQVADLMVNGYIVAPGSTVLPDGAGHPGGFYQIENASQPVEAPAELVKRVRQAAEQALPVEGEVRAERSQIVDGERDHELTSIAGFLRHKGFDEQAIAQMLVGITESGAVEQPPGREVTQQDCERIARSIAKKSTGKTSKTGVLVPAAIELDSEITGGPEQFDWILPDFVPAVGLTILYGDGKIGKSSWASWLASQVTQGGKAVLFIGSGEETFEDFVRRARLSGHQDGLLYGYGEVFWLPSGVPRLEETLGLLGNVGLVYIDAVYSHFAHTDAQNAAEKARSRLRPLAEMAQRCSVAVLGTIHENATGGMLGSREMRNVARSVIHAKRVKGGDFTIWPKGANAAQADYGVSFPGTPVPVLDPVTGQVRTWTNLFGETREQATWVLRLGDKIVGDEDSERFVNTDDLAERLTPKKRTLDL